MTVPNAWQALACTELPAQEGQEAPFNLPFLTDPLSALSVEQRQKLRDDLSELARQRREAEADNATLRLG